MTSSSTSVSGSTTSDISLSSQALSKGYPSYTREHVAPYILADLIDSEECSVDQLLAVFLERCRTTDPLTPRIQQSVGSSPYSSPSSTATEKPLENSSEASADPTSLTPELQGTVDDPPVSCETLQSCLQKVLPLCHDTELRQLIQNYQDGVWEKTRYKPFVEFANRGLELVKLLELSELREPSDSHILFHVSDRTALDGKDSSVRYPDIMIVPLASAERVNGNSTGGQKENVQYGHPKPHDRFEWPDVLIHTEMKSYRQTLNYKQPATYDTRSKCPLGSLPTRQEDHDFASIVTNNSPPINDVPSNTLASSTFTPTDSTHDVTFPISRAENAEAGDSSTSTHRKRPYECPDQSASDNRPTKKARTENKKIKQHMIDALSQLGTGAAEMLRCSLGRRHALGMIIIGEVFWNHEGSLTKVELDGLVWIWWFDRQGAIQSRGISFIEDLPRFLVFLLAIQRFNLSDWGFDEELDPSIPLRHSLDKSPTPQEVELEFNGKDGTFKVGFTSDMAKLKHGLFNLRGKSTNVFEVTTPDQPPRVAKMYWPNQGRPHEVDIINRARQIDGLANHLPLPFGSRVIDPLGTRRIRDELGISFNSPRPPRELLIIIFEELFPITTLTKDDFVFAWLECIRCHYLAWEGNIRHLDLSLGNLMLRPRLDTDERMYFGVVNDWDLGDFEAIRPEARKYLAKTILFTALELLGPALPQTLVVQRYSHDLESFLWIIVWVFFAVRQGEIQPIANVAGWRTGVPDLSLSMRAAFIAMPGLYIPHEEWESYQHMVTTITQWLYLRSQMIKPNAPPVVEDNLEMLRGLLEVIGSSYQGPRPTLPQIKGL